MNIESLSEICNAFPSVETDIKWEHNLCFTIGSKIFMIISLDDIPTACAFKVSKDDFETLTELSGVIQAPHFARNQWVKVQDLNLFSATEWQELVTKSFNLISQKLSIKKQKELGLIQP